jgi:hypothetical protein
VGLVVEGSTHAAGVPGTAATWVAPTGRAAVGVLSAGGGVAVAGHTRSCGCMDAVRARSPRGAGRVRGRTVLLWFPR